MSQTLIRSHVPARRAPVAFAIDQVQHYARLADIGININDAQINRMMGAVGMDSLQGNVLPASIAARVQFLQTWLPGFVNVMTAGRKIDELVGVTTAGDWQGEEVVQQIMELIGTAQPYTDYGPVPFSSWSNAYERRSIVRFEEGMRVGKLEDMRATAAMVNDSVTKREAAAEALEISRNEVGFYGYNAGANRTYGFLNDPSLLPYVSAPGPEWDAATYLEITATLRAAFAALRQQGSDRFDPATVATTLALPTNKVDYLTVTSEFGNSVKQWLAETYPKCRVVSVPQLEGANGGADVFYLYAETLPGSGSDNGRVIEQIVPVKFQMIGSKQEVKEYVEDYTNATAGILVKRPWAIVRVSGI